MTPLRGAALALLAAAAAAVGWVLSLLAERQGWATPIMSWVSLLTLMVLAVGMVSAGLWVYRTRTRKARRAISPLAAVRVLVLAQSAAYVGATWLGWHAGVLLQLVSGGSFGSANSWTSLFQVGGGVVLVVVGFVVQALCKIPPTDGDGADRQAGKKRPEQGGAPGVQGAR